MPTTELAVPALTSDEQVLVDSLLTSRAQVCEVLPDDMKGDDVWKILTACTKSLVVYRKSISTLKPVIGRLLVIAQNNPTIYRERGYVTFDDFCSRGLYELLGVPRSEAYQAKRLVEKWPSLSMEDFQRVSYSKLIEISKFTSESEVDSNKWLEAAQTNTLDGLRDQIAQKKGIPREDLDMVTVTVVVSKKDRDFWNEVSKSPKVHGVVGSESAGRIFMNAMDALWAHVHSVETAEAV